MSWDENLSFGTSIENFLIDYFDEMFGWKFVAGTRNGQIENKEFIEKVFSCDVILPSLGFGTRLVFDNGQKARMPDILLKSKNDLLFWVESKASNYQGYSTIDIEEKKISDYEIIKKNTKKPVWVIITVVNNGFCEIYASRIQTLIKNGEKIKEHFWGTEVRRYYLDDSNVFSKLTKDPIQKN
jgi:hypothetical protein